MQAAEEYIASQYQELGAVDDKNRIQLMRNRLSGTICVKKLVSQDSENVYDFLSKLKSPYIPEIFECVRLDDQLVIIEEYIGGNTIEEILRERDIPEAEAADIILNVCEALKPLHNADPAIVCRDLKAENIMIDKSGNVKLIDFDIARTYQPGKSRDTKLLGTREYAAPEQFGYSQTDARTDIYALGILLNYMILKKFPVEQTLEDPLGSVVRKCIQIDPSNRYKNVSELEEDIKRQLKKHKTHSLKDPSKSFLPPGFRTGVWWKMLVGAAGYVFVTWFCFSKSSADEGLAHLKLNKTALWLSQIFFIGILFNYRGIRDRLPLTKNKRIWLKAAGLVIYWFVLIYAAALILALIEMIL